MRCPPVRPLIAAGLAGLGAATVAATPGARQSTGSISLLGDEAPLAFEFTTDSPDDTNWVALYGASGGGPVDQAYVADSLVWARAPGENGIVSLAAESLRAGRYQAFFLAKDGYEWLADPIEVAYAGPPADVSFIASKTTLQNARQGDAYEADISGLVSGGGNSTVQFAVVESDDDWIQLSPDGGLSGTPGPSSQETRLRVTATASDSTAQFDVTIPVRPSGAPLVSQLSVMTYNLWHGGTQVTGYHEKQVRFLVDSNVDVVGLQESTGDHATRLGNALGWYSWQGDDCGIISRYPIVEVYPASGHGGSVRIALDGEESQINLWNVHLGYTPYGPYDLCFDHMTVEEVLAREAQSQRTPQIIETVEAMGTNLTNSNSVPVLLTGDFNAPSHLDYTEALRDKNCGYADVPWPTSKRPTDAGLVDSFRVAHPDPSEAQGITWSPIYLENEGRPEPLDRIDFIYHKGDLSVRDSRRLIVGSPTPEPNHQNNEWTSDHYAVRTVYELTPETNRLVKQSSA